MPETRAVRQFELLREIFDLARAQRASLEQDDIERMLDLMTEREAILDRLIRLVEAPEEEPANVLAFPGTPDLSRQDAIALDTVIRGIMEHDEENANLLAERMDALRQELPAVQQGRRVATAYRAAGSGAS